MTIAPDETIQLSPDLTLEWYFEHQVVVYVPLSISRRTTDMIVDNALDVMRTQNPAQPFLTMFDVSNILSLTPYARTRSQEITALLTELGKHGATSVVLGRSMVSNVIRLFVERDLRKTNSRVPRMVTQDKQEGLQWLHEQLAANQQQNDT